MTAPCKDCPDRSVRCHSEREKYIAFTEERKRILRKQYQMNEITEALKTSARELRRIKQHEQFQKKGLR